MCGEWGGEGWQGVFRPYNSRRSSEHLIVVLVSIVALDLAERC